MELHHNGSTAAARDLIDREIIEKQKALVNEGQKLSIFLSFFITTLVVLFFMAMLVFTFQSLQDDLFEASPYVQVLTLSAPVVALLALSIAFNFKRITSPVLFRIQKVLFYPVDFAYKVWSEEFRHEFSRRENYLKDVIETQEDAIASLEEKIKSHRTHGKNLQGLLKEQMSAQNYSEEAMRALLSHLGEYVLFIDAHGFVPDYFSRSVINLVGYEPKGDNFSRIAKFSHTEHVEFLAFISHAFDNHHDFYQFETFAPKKSFYTHSIEKTVTVNWRYRPHYHSNGKLMAIIAIGNREQTGESLAGLSMPSFNSSQDMLSIPADSVIKFANQIAQRHDTQLKKSFEKAILLQPMKYLVPSLEQYIYAAADGMGKEVEFDFYKTVETKVNVKSFKRAEALLSELSHYLINQHLETPIRRKQVGKVSCGRLKLDVDLKRYGAKGAFYRLEIDGPGISVDQLQIDLTRAGLAGLTEHFSEDAVNEILFNKQLNQYYMDTYLDRENTIAKPVNLSRIKDEINKMRGSIRIESEPGLSTIIDLYIPESLS